MSKKNIKRVSVKTTIELDMDSSVTKITVKRVKEKSLSNDFYKLQTAMMLAITKLMKEMLDSVYVQPDEEVEQ